jgi:hypothetical protein
VIAEFTDRRDLVEVTKLLVRSVLQFSGQKLRKFLLGTST